MLLSMDLEQFPAFNGLATNELELLRGILKAVVLPAKTVVIELGEPADSVHFILTGTVRTLVHRPRGKEVVLGILGRGEIIGEIGAIDSQNRSASVVTIEPTVLLSMGVETFRQCLESVPTLSRNLLLSLAKRVRRLTDQVEAHATLDLHGRIERQLLIFANDYGEPSDDGDLLLNLHITQGDIGKLVGASRGRVNQILGYYKKYQFISTTDHHRIILHQKALKQWSA